MTLEDAISEIPFPWYVSTLHGSDPHRVEPWRCTLRHSKLREIAKGEGTSPVEAVLEAIERIPAAEAEPEPALFNGSLRPKIDLSNLIEPIRRRL